MNRHKPVRAFVSYCALVLGAATGLLAARCLPGTVAGVAAATLTVDRADDDPTATACTDAPNDCSLRGAIMAANALPTEASDITVPANTYALSQSTPCTYRTLPPWCQYVDCTFTTSQVSLCVTGHLTIHGAGASTTIVDAGGLARVLLVSADANLEIRGMTLSNGSMIHPTVAEATPAGGGIGNYGALVLTDSVVEKSSAREIGGGIFNVGTLALVRSAVRENFATDGFLSRGGGIYSIATTMTATDSTIADNSAQNKGGGIFVEDGSCTLRGTTVSGNQALNLEGGGIDAIGINAEPTIAITNSTISGNATGYSGGGIQVNIRAHVNLQNVTITNNAAVRGGGFHNELHGVTTLRNTVVAGNTVSAGGVGPDCSAYDPISSGGYNLIGALVPGDCPITGDTASNLTNVDAKLAPLAGNGGPTRTHGLAQDSPAVDAGDPTGCTDEQATVLTSDQREYPRPVDGNDDGNARCDIGAFELGGSFSVTSIQPYEGGDAGSVLAIIHGTGFASGAIVKLTRTGETDVVGTETNVDASGEIASTRFDLTGQPRGAWDVVVENPGGTSAVASGAFTVAAARPPDLWVDVAGPSTVRVGWPFRFILLYGNRGNTDAFAIPLTLGVPQSCELQPLFRVAPPPQQFGKIVVRDYGIYYQEIVAGDGPPLNELVLLLPVVPAGFTGALEIVVTSPLRSLSSTLPLRLEIGDSMFVADAPDPGAVARLVDGAKQKSARLFGYTIPSSVDADLGDYMTTQLDTVVREGVASLAQSFGIATTLYSVTQLGYDLAAFGMIWADNHPPLASASANAPLDLQQWPSASEVASTLAAMCVAPALAQDLSCVCGVGPKGANCCEGCSCPKDDVKDTEPPASCKIKDIGKSDKCKPPTSPGECIEIGFKVVRGLEGGTASAYCTNNPRCVLTNTAGGVSCIRFPLRPVGSQDPNDKSGPVGAGDARFIMTAVPLHYTIEFENVATATAPAAAVVITDQLDPSHVDLTTLSLGPIDFGATQHVPPPGVTALAKDIDLRPATNLIVRVEAKLEAGTALLTWRLTSLDPVTMQPPSDPLTGFLPPDKIPPEGSGHVAFTVAPLGTLTTGTQVQNQARIVFDANDPIDTPMWSNTIDVSTPTSAITSATAAGACSRDVSVGWSGTDDGAGIDVYDIAVSEDGGDFEPWTTAAQTSGTFRGKWGSIYAFRSMAQDKAGNRQETPSAASPPVTISDCGPHDLAVTKVVPPKVVKLTRARPAQTVLVKVEIQNRGPHPETFDDEATLAKVVSLAVKPLAPGCPDPSVRLHSGKPQKPLPLILASKKKVLALFDVVFDCAIDATKGKGHEDFSLTAAVDQTALGGTDAHQLDDVCPRTVSPRVKDPYPNGKLTEQGCGPKKDGVVGGPVLVDVMRVTR